MTVKDTNLDEYYAHVLRTGNLRSREHAELWTNGVLMTLGTCLDGGAKKALANVLPDELSRALKGVFWLLHFRDSNQTGLSFRRAAARRSGNSDSEFALYPTLAVFGGIKQFLDPELDRRVAKSLSPEVRELWQEAEPAAIAR